MIFYGTKAVHLQSVQSKKAICPSCEQQGTTLLSVFRKHAHVFWIPIFPIGKKGASECEHCKKVLKPAHFPDSFKEEYQHLKNESKGPIWQFSGLVLIAILIVLGNYIDGQDKLLEKEYIDSPVVGDVYEYELDTGYYSTLKVTDVSNDTVFVVPNNYEISKISRIYKIDKEENYTGDSYGIAIGNLKEMYREGAIIDINR